MDKSQGGLEIKRLDNMNIALLTKWWWKLVSKPESLIVWVLEEKYQSKDGTWSGKERNPSDVSIFWKGIMSVKEIFTVGLYFELGNGQDISSWKHKWFGGGRLKDVA